MLGHTPGLLPWRKGEKPNHLCKALIMLFIYGPACQRRSISSGRSTSVHAEARIMLSAEEWDSVIARLVGVTFRGTERVLTRHVLDQLKVPNDRGEQQKVSKQLG